MKGRNDNPTGYLSPQLVPTKVSVAGRTYDLGLKMPFEAEVRKEPQEKEAKCLGSMQVLIHANDVEVNKAAQRLVVELANQVGQQRPTNPVPISTAAVVDAYLIYKDDGGAAEGYLKVRARKVRFFARQYPELPTSPEPLRDYLRQFKTGVVPTRQDQWKALSDLYKYASREYHISNPMLAVDKPHFKKKPGKRLSKDEAKQFVGAIETDLEWAIATCYFGLRLRRIEAERLLSGEIKSDYITVTDGKERGEELPLLSIFRELLLKLENHGPEGRHFPIRGDTMAYHIGRIGERAGLRVTPHMLRNTAAALWYHYNGDKSSNRMLLRHSTDDMTDHYSNQFLDELRVKDERHNPMLNLMRELGLAPPYPNTSSAPPA